MATEFKEGMRVEWVGQGGRKKQGTITKVRPIVFTGESDLDVSFAEVLVDSYVGGVPLDKLTVISEPAK